MKPTVVLFILTTIGYVIGQVLYFVNLDLLAYLVQVNVLVSSGYYWELITSIFVTPNFFDWAFNSIALYFIYWLYRSEAGKLEYVIFLASGFVGNVFSYFFYPPMTASAGASGGIFGLFAYYTVSDYLKDKQVNQVGIILLIASFLLSSTLVIFKADIWAHVGGILTGVILSLLLYKIRE